MMKKIMIHRKYLFMLSGALLIASLIMAITISPSQKNTLQKANQNTINYAEKFEGFKAGTVLKVEYISNKENSPSDQAIIKQNKTTATFNNNNALTHNAQYQVLYIIIDNNQHYIDASLTFNKRNGDLRATLAGLKSGERVSLIINNQIYHHPTPVDWAGRIELQLSALPSLDNATICMKINRNNNQDATLCHHCPLAKRQVRS